MHEASRSAARAHTHETFFRFPMERLRADVARLALRVLGARLRRDRDGRRVLLICIILFGAACFLYQFAEFVMAALFPVFLLAGRPTVAGLAAAALLGGPRWQSGSADWALCEEHAAPSVCWWYLWSQGCLVNATPLLCMCMWLSGWPSSEMFQRPLSTLLLDTLQPLEDLAGRLPQSRF